MNDDETTKRAETDRAYLAFSATLEDLARAALRKFAGTASDDTLVEFRHDSSGTSVTLSEGGKRMCVHLSLDGFAPEELRQITDQLAAKLEEVAPVTSHTAAGEPIVTSSRLH